MRYYGLDLNLLAVLEAIALDQNVTRAAQRLNLTQPAVSAALGRLRQHFNDQLFVAVGGRMVPTPLMRALEPKIRQVLETSRDIAVAAVQFEPATAERRFFLTASDYVIAVLVPQLLQRLAVAAPGIDLTVQSLPLLLSSSEQVASESLERHSADFVIIPRAFASPHYPSVPLFSDDFTVIVAASNSRVGEELNLETYLALPHVSREVAPSGPISMEAAFLAEQGLERRVAVAVDQFALIPEFVVNSERIATLHTRLARRYARRFPIRLVAPPVAFPPTEQLLQWHPYQDGDPAVRWMVELLQATAAGQ